ncbi:50S ribosome-binding GTPase [Domibacillus sp. A3M-37]|uniref:GTPase family protein n=1 Tax=Domibacillus sp. A3M-37 TaxID=2962037 RepID=UPI0020B8ADCE|nr:GTPase [Domibacillus sp. A3M-37]MCP3764580.1 50S ribosome-binding GTPase [Domibacillus sp. A3M-37]
MVSFWNSHFTTDLISSVKNAIPYKDYREEDIRRKINAIGYNPIDIMVTGITGAGKSTTLNALFQKEVAKEGEGVDPETMEISSYSLSDERIRLWDTPGLGDGVIEDINHSKKIIDLLYKPYGENSQFGFIDLALIVLDGGSRDLGTTYKLLNEIIVPNMPSDRILIAINQCDMGMKGKYWDAQSKTPHPELVAQLEEKSMSVVNRVYEATGLEIKKPIYYSAKNDYNIYKLLDLIVDNLPSTSRRLK